MKRRNLALAALLLFVLSVQAQAVLYANRADPQLRFDGTTAYCSGQVRSSNASGAIEATLTLWHGRTAVDSWSESGTGSVDLSGSCTVKKGERYTLTIDATVNGVPIPQKSTSGTC